jgi:hypothetical protein
MWFGFFTACVFLLFLSRLSILFVLILGCFVGLDLLGELPMQGRMDIET